MTWANFKFEDFACKHCGENKTKEFFIDLLQILRDKCGFPLPVSSGYRCPVHNVEVSTTGPSGPHTTGLAVDFLVDRDRAVIVIEYALEQPQFRGFGFNQKGATGRFIHLDVIDRPTKTCWSY